MLTLRFVARRRRRSSSRPRGAPGAAGRRPPASAARPRSSRKKPSPPRRSIVDGVVLFRVRGVSSFPADGARAGHRRPHRDGRRQSRVHAGPLRIEEIGVGEPDSG